VNLEIDNTFLMLSSESLFPMMAKKEIAFEDCELMSS
jgi:hypothetical protein